MAFPAVSRSIQIRIRWHFDGDAVGSVSLEPVDTLPVRSVATLDRMIRQRRGPWRRRRETGCSETQKNKQGAQQASGSHHRCPGRNGVIPRRHRRPRIQECILRNPLPQSRQPEQSTLSCADATCCHPALHERIPCRVPTRALACRGPQAVNTRRCTVARLAA